MSDSVTLVNRVGAYEQPFSGVGVRFEPLGIEADQSGIVLHEAGFHPANDNWNFPSVFSPFWRLYYNTGGEHCVVFGEEFFTLDKDQLCLIPDHQLFHCLGLQPSSSFWLHFSFDRKPSRQQAIPILLEPDAVELGLIRKISGLIGSESDGQVHRINRLGIALLNIVLSRQEMSWRPAIPRQLSRIIQYIEEHVGSRIPNERLAQLAGVSVESVYRLFRQHLGTSPAQHISQVRIRKASHLLLQEEYSIEQIAELTGFPNRAYFSRIFKQVTGVPPATFRASHGS